MHLRAIVIPSGDIRKQNCIPQYTDAVIIGSNHYILIHFVNSTNMTPLRFKKYLLGLIFLGEHVKVLTCAVIYPAVYKKKNCYVRFSHMRRISKCFLEIYTLINLHLNLLLVTFTGFSGYARWYSTYTNDLMLQFFICQTRNYLLSVHCDTCQDTVTPEGRSREGVKGCCDI